MMIVMIYNISEIIFVIILYKSFADAKGHEYKSFWDEV